MSIKDNLSDLIAANGYDINNDEVRSALLSLAGSNIIKLPLDKKHIAIRTLSKDEFDKYIINGTCDGSITKCNTNVWNYFQNESKCACYTIFGRAARKDEMVEISKIENTEVVSEISGNTVYNRTRSSSALANYELIQNSSNNNCYIYNTVMPIFRSMFAGNDGARWIAIISDININPEEIDKTVTNNELSATAKDSCNNKMILTVSYYINYRPIFNFVDNNKSKNIYY